MAVLPVVLPKSPQKLQPSFNRRNSLRKHFDPLEHPLVVIVQEVVVIFPGVQGIKRMEADNVEGLKGSNIMGPGGQPIVNDKGQEL